LAEAVNKHDKDNPECDTKSGTGTKSGTKADTKDSTQGSTNGDAKQDTKGKNGKPGRGGRR
jgi:hypothetical protein|tara:strand:+ start:9036 stop:9218 length:183 start_codon:yes stop_codon:yes gene_type:complete